jgi:FecR protein
MSDNGFNSGGVIPGSFDERAIRALGRLPRARASEPAERAARASFMTGAVQPLREERTVKPGRTMFRRLLLGYSIAAAAAIVFFMIGSEPTMEWVVLDVVEPAGVQVTEATPPAVGDRLDSGTLITAAGSELELQLGDRLRFRMLPGTQIELPKAPGRWFGRSRELELASGEIYGTTGGKQLGFDLDFKTDELTAVLTGTTFAVFRTDLASCVCLWEGGVKVTPSAEPDLPTLLQPNQRVWVYKDGRPREVLPLNDMEIMKLQMTSDMGLSDTLPDAP